MSDKLSVKTGRKKKSTNAFSPEKNSSHIENWDRLKCLIKSLEDGLPVLNVVYLGVLGALNSVDRKLLDQGLIALGDAFFGKWNGKALRGDAYEDILREELVRDNIDEKYKVFYQGMVSRRSELLSNYSNNELDEKIKLLAANELIALFCWNFFRAKNYKFVVEVFQAILVGFLDPYGLNFGAIFDKRFFIEGKDNFLELIGGFHNKADGFLEIKNQLCDRDFFKLMFEFFDENPFVIIGFDDFFSGYGQTLNHLKRREDFIGELLRELKGFNGWSDLERLDRVAKDFLNWFDDNFPRENHESTDQLFNRICAKDRFCDKGNFDSLVQVYNGFRGIYKFLNNNVVECEKSLVEATKKFNLAKSKYLSAVESSEGSVISSLDDNYKRARKELISYISFDVFCSGYFDCFESKKHFTSSELSLGERLDECANISCASAYFDEDALAVALHDVDECLKTLGNKKSVRDQTVVHKQHVGIVVHRNLKDEQGNELDEPRRVELCNATRFSTNNEGNIAHMYCCYVEPETSSPVWENDGGDSSNMGRQSRIPNSTIAANVGSRLSNQPKFKGKGNGKRKGGGK